MICKKFIVVLSFWSLREALGGGHGAESIRTPPVGISRMGDLRGLELRLGRGRRPLRRSHHHRTRAAMVCEMAAARALAITVSAT